MGANTDQKKMAGVYFEVVKNYKNVLLPGTILGINMIGGGVTVNGNLCDSMSAHMITELIRHETQHGFNYLDRYSMLTHDKL
jgi:hypothetical protein